MIFVAPIYNKNQLVSIKNVDAVVLMVPHFSIVYEDDFNIEEAVNYCHQNQITPILGINKIFLENEIRVAKTFIEKYKNEMFLVSDLGIINYIKNTLSLDKVIYDSSTLVCNSSDYQIYKKFGFNAISMSNEIPIKDVIKVANASKNVFYQVFGRKLMFYSKRKLISLYKEFKGVDFSNKDLSLMEEKRSYHIPIIENDEGFSCYRHYLISLHKFISELANLKYAYFETLTLTIDQVNQVTHIYKNLINNLISSEEIENSFKMLNLDIEEGFENTDTVYVKEKIVQ